MQASAAAVQDPRGSTASRHSSAEASKSSRCSLVRLSHRSSCTHFTVRSSRDMSGPASTSSSPRRALNEPVRSIPLPGNRAAPRYTLDPPDDHPIHYYPGVHEIAVKTEMSRHGNNPTLPKPLPKAKPLVGPRVFKKSYLHRADEQHVAGAAERRNDSAEDLAALLKNTSEYLRSIADVQRSPVTFGASWTSISEQRVVVAALRRKLEQRAHGSQALNARGEAAVLFRRFAELQVTVNRVSPRSGASRALLTSAQCSRA